MASSISDLKFDHKNARKRTDSSARLIQESLQRYGAARSIVIDEENRILAGNGTIEAAKALGLAKLKVVEAAGDEIIAVRRSGLSEDEKVGLAIADNRAAELSDWDAEMLQQLSEEHDLQPWFEAEDLEHLLKDAEHLDPVEGKTDPDDVPEPPADPITKPGDLWILGNHRLLCGDSTDVLAVERLMAGKKADLCFTSPPYGQQRDYTAEGKEKVQDWDALMQGVFSVLPVSDSAQVLVNLGLIHRDGEWVPYWDGWIKFMSQLGWRRFGWYVWDQGPGMPGDWNGRLAPSHEFIWHFNKQSIRAAKARECKHAGEAHGGKGQRGKDGVVKERSSGTAPVQSHAIHDSIFRVNRQGAMHGADGHPAPYPVGLPLIALQSWSGDIYEPFCGSGTTLIAAEQLGRKCYGIEISPVYCDVIVKRWEDFTGNTAVCIPASDHFSEHQDAA